MAAPDRSDLMLYLILLALVVGGCNMPQESSDPQPQPGGIETAAAQTVAVHLTQAAERGQIVSTATPFPEFQASPSADLTQAGDPGTPAPTASACDRVRFIKDVTIPDGEDLQPGEEFTKTWRLENAGTCSWTAGYSLVFDRGDALSGPTGIPVSVETVEPGDTVDVSVDLVAPAETGTYQGFWKLRNAQGGRFGIGADSKAFWVKIDVVEGSGVRFDFNQFADEAAWGSGTLPVNFQEVGENPLVLGEDAADGEAQVTLLEDQRMEDGDSSGRVLETTPPGMEGGYVIGQFPGYRVSASDQLTGQIGFIKNPGGGCGSGDVTYQIHYFVGGNQSTLQKFWEWHEICDDLMKSFRFELRELTGEEVHFVLVVIANTPSEENYAAWESLRIIR